MMFCDKIIDRPVLHPHIGIDEQQHLIRSKLCTLPTGVRLTRPPPWQWTCSNHRYTVSLCNLGSVVVGIIVDHDDFVGRQQE